MIPGPGGFAEIVVQIDPVLVFSDPEELDHEFILVDSEALKVRLDGLLYGPLVPLRSLVTAADTEVRLVLSQSAPGKLREVHSRFSLREGLRNGCGLFRVCK